MRHLTLYKKEAATRELARETGIAAPNILKLLKELEKENILKSRKIGNSISYSLNRSNILVAKIIIPAFGLENSLIQELGGYLAEKLAFPAISIILFGSRARGEEKPGSDIDLLFIVKPGDEAECEKNVLNLNPAISAAFGASVAPVVYSDTAFKARLARKDELAKEMFKEGKVIFGKYFSDYL
ncbi:MAG: nucleotidyltransferase domain-containing protein [Nitrospirae bacterium]|nr:nucleotidyltransferase domain-containing protein [Nitrospirota bacterium]